MRQNPAPGRGRLLRVLGIGFGISVGVGAAIGGGILRVPALVASELPHPGWIALLWLLVTGFVFIDANTHSELSAMTLPFVRFSLLFAFLVPLIRRVTRKRPSPKA